jgi:WD40 repeat protein
LEWSPNGKLIALGVGSNNHTVMIYDTSNNTLRLSCNTGTADAWNVAWSPDGKYIAVACQDTNAACTYNAAAPCPDNTVQVFNIEEDGYNKLTFHLHKGNVWGVDWSPDGRYIASGGFDNKIFVWEAKDGSVVFSGEHSDIVYGVAWSPDGTNIT